jgi:uncharacterized membrane protein YphA (DoxX/SURF4 family)
MSWGQAEVPALLATLAGAVGSASRACVGLVFCSAAPSKLLHRREFEGVVGAYRILPEGLARPASYALPVTELGLGVLLIVGVAARAAAGMAIALLLLFAWAMAVNLRRGRDHIDCGCGGGSQRQTLSWALVWRNLGLAGLASAAALSSSAVDLPIQGAAFAGGAVLFLIYLLFNTLAALPGFARTAA